MQKVQVCLGFLEVNYSLIVLGIDNFESTLF